MKDKNRVLVERREHRRFSVKEQAVAQIKSHTDSLTGQIKNISLGGLSFTVNEKTIHSNEIYELAIVLEKENFRIDRISFKIVCHNLLDQGLSADNEPMELFCVKFKEISPSQLYHLERFIMEHTNGPAH